MWHEDLYNHHFLILRRMDCARETYGDEFEDVYQVASHENFVQTLKDSTESIIESGALRGKQLMIHDRVRHLLKYAYIF